MCSSDLQIEEATRPTDCREPRSISELPTWEAILGRTQRPPGSHRQSATRHRHAQPAAFVQHLQREQLVEPRSGGQRAVITEEPPSAR